MRLDVYLQKHFPFRSRSEAQDWIRQGWVYLQRGNEFLEKNKIKCAFQVEEGEGTEGVEWTEGGVERVEGTEWTEGVELGLRELRGLSNPLSGFTFGIRNSWEIGLPVPFLSSKGPSNI